MLVAETIKTCCAGRNIRWSFKDQFGRDDIRNCSRKGMVGFTTGADGDDGFVLTRKWRSGTQEHEVRRQVLMMAFAELWLHSRLKKTSHRSDYFHWKIETVFIEDTERTNEYIIPDVLITVWFWWLDFTTVENQFWKFTLTQDYFQYQCFNTALALQNSLTGSVMQYRWHSKRHWSAGNDLQSTEDHQKHLVKWSKISISDEAF